MSRYFIIYFSSIAMLFLVASSIAQTKSNQTSLSFAYLDFPPISYTNEKGEAQGYMAHRMMKTLETAGYSWHARPFPAKRLARSLIEGKVDLWATTTDHRWIEEHTFIGSTPLTTITLSACMKDNLPPIKKKEDLVGKTVIVMRGYSYADWGDFIHDAANDITLLTTDSHEQALLALNFGRGDYLLGYYEPIKKAWDKLPVKGARCEVLEEFSLYLIASKKLKNAQEILHSIEKAYLELEQSGTFDHHPYTFLGIH